MRLKVPSSKIKDLDPADLAEILGQRVRCTDTVGWLRECLAVLLPDTPGEGAERLGTDVCAKLGAHARVSVYSYPLEVTAPGSGSEQFQAAWTGK